MILPFVVFEFEAWSFTLSEECRLKMFTKKVLRRIFGPRRDEVTGEWRRLHNDKLYAVCSSPNIVQVIKSRRRWEGHVVCMAERRGAYRVLMEKPEGRTSLGRWEDNIKKDHGEVRHGGMDWIDLAQDRDRWLALVNAIMNVLVP
jgi:hypothetical protein